MTILGSDRMASLDRPIGETLRKIRRDHRLSLRHVAEKAGISVATLSRVETSKQSVDVMLLLALAKVLGVSANDILCGDGDGQGEIDRAELARHIEKLQAPERAKLLLHIARGDSKPLHATMDDLLIAIDLIRDELLHVQRSINRRKK